MSEMESHKGKVEKVNFPVEVNSSAEKLLFLGDYFGWKFEVVEEAIKIGREAENEKLGMIDKILN